MLATLMLITLLGFVYWYRYNSVGFKDVKLTLLITIFAKVSELILVEEARVSTGTPLEFWLKDLDTVCFVGL